MVALKRPPKTKEPNDAHPLFKTSRPSSWDSFENAGGLLVSTQQDPFEELKKHIVEGIESRQHRVIFQKHIQALWPCQITEERKRQIDQIHAFAAANGWSVRIRDAGISATFRKPKNDSPKTPKPKL